MTTTEAPRQSSGQATKEVAETKETPVKTEAFSVIETGGKQYKVSVGSVITIEKMEGSFKEGDKVTFDSVILTDNGSKTVLGEPTISGAKVEGEFVEGGRGKKVTVIHYKSKSRYFRKNGHRQPFNKVKITKI